MDRIGFGSNTSLIAVYVEKRPLIPEYQSFQDYRPLLPNEIEFINNRAGNGWRKLFNVYAKIIEAINLPGFESEKIRSWQQYRDTHLLKSSGQEALLFSPPRFSRDSTIHIIAGRTYAKKLINEGKLCCSLIWLNEEFAIDKENKLIICPFFDYRQLSNTKIDYLKTLIDELCLAQI
ncbi:hypothetical protein PALB_14080 [Pseudoalteromonas luteoviolacea B = ATCC 29581]|nr:hypothetical protein PALB_14080 [Pseudoalteromonas luteoviolacea B = ATCC 29581]